MDLSTFAIAILLLLLTPGPTNTLLAVSGASKGFPSSMPLIGAELAGYLTTIIPLATFAGRWLATAPMASVAVGLASATWVMILAARMWTNPPMIGGGAEVTFRRVYLTTALNPKGLIIGLVLIPPGTATGIDLFAHLGIFATSVIVVAHLWIIFGATVLSSAARLRPVVFGRVAASFLLVFAVSIAGRAVGLL